MSKINLDFLKNVNHTFIKELVTLANTLFLLSDMIYDQKTKTRIIKTTCHYLIMYLLC